MRADTTPGELRCEWLLLLLAPVAWAAALPVLFALTEDACVRGVRDPLWSVAGACLCAALVPLPVAWWRARRIEDAHRAADRARFLLRVAMGLSALFALVLVMMTIPIWLLDSCRT